MNLVRTDSFLSLLLQFVRQQNGIWAVEQNRLSERSSSGPYSGHPQMSPTYLAAVC